MQHLRPRQEPARGKGDPPAQARPAEIADQHHLPGGGRHLAHKLPGFLVAQIMQKERRRQHVVTIGERVANNVELLESHTLAVASSTWDRAKSIARRLTSKPRISSFSPTRLAFRHRARGTSPEPVAISSTRRRSASRSRARRQMAGQRMPGLALRKLIRCKALRARSCSAASSPGSSMISGVSRRDWNQPRSLTAVP